MKATAALALPLLAISEFTSAAYTVLQESYTPSNFFSEFDFFTGPDPTHGFVRYVDQPEAEFMGLTRKHHGGIYIGVDYTNDAPMGRSSVRLESKARFQRGLFLLDVSHMPGGICGTWPAFWTVGNDWPNNGEIDIIEGVNRNPRNLMALHTSDGCSVDEQEQLSFPITNDCYIHAPGQYPNQGCSSQDPRRKSYGTGFNAIGGGMYAMEWTSWFIKVWFFPRGSIPDDALDGNPEPADWGTPTALFQGDCDIDGKFREHRIVIDTTFCGDWAGGDEVWKTSGCPASSCPEFVANNPEAFAEAYWVIKSLKVWSS